MITTPATVVLTIDDTTVINTTSAHADDIDELTAVDRLTISWSHPNARLHEEAGSLRISLRHPVAGVITLGSKLTVAVVVDSVLIELGSWWVQSVEWRRLPSGAWLHAVDAVDTVGLAAGIRLASTPWPADQDLEQRVDAINAASPITLVEPPGWDGFNAPLLGRDVDNADALDIIQRTAATWGRCALAGVDGIVLHAPAATRIIVGHYMTPSVPVSSIVERGPAPVTLPANVIESAPRGLSRAGLITVARINFWIEDLDTGETSEAARSWRNPAPGQPTASLIIDTDFRHTTSAAWPLDPADAYLGDMAAIAAGIAAEGSTPRPQLTAARIVVDQLPQLADLISIHTRTRIILTISGAPADVDPTVHIAAGAISIRAGRLALQLTLAPAITAGLRPMRWSDWPTPTTVPDPPIMGDPVATRWSHTGPPAVTAPADLIRISDTRLVAAPTSWRTS